MLAAARLAYAGRDLATAERLARAGVGSPADLDGGLLHSTLLSELGRHEEADDVLAALADAATTDAEHALVALRRSVHLMWALGDPDAAGAIERAEAAVTDVGWRQELTAQRVNLLALGGHPADALAAGVGLLESAVERVVVRASTGAAVARALAAHFDDAIRVAGAAWRLQGALADQRGFGSAGFHLVIRTLAAIDSGRLAEATSHASRAYQVTVETGDAIGQGWFALALARADLARGDVGAARRWAGESAALWADTKQRALLRGALGTVALATAQAGDRLATDAAIEELDRTPPGPLAFLEPDVARARAWHVALGGDLAAARTALVTDARAWRARGAVAAVVAMAGDLVRLDGSDEGADLLDGLSWPEPWPVGDATRAWVDADDGPSLEAVARSFEGLGMVVFAAEAAAHASAAWQADGSARNARRAAAWSKQLAAGSGAATPALTASAHAGLLTRREREVARLVAAGASTRAIAERLRLSERTVENHLQRVYVKLGITRRDQLSDALGTEATTL
jgi:DNA-binding CsgD family transcriptional regulator